ncbi:MAG: hypothetical protein LBG67_04810 [Campylobacteraceae bacterium]|jgi:uncharacterized membrane protein|nr:hypothetical protein [Campylobacteraceae bacterium]
MQDDDIIKKAKLIYELFFLYVIVVVSAFMIWYFANISLGSGFRHLPSVTFLTAGVLSFIYYDSKKDNWVNDHLLWQRNSFIVMVIGGLIVILSGYLSANVDITISTLYINHAFILSILIVIALSFAVWFLYRFVAGAINFFNRLSPHESKKKT